MSEYKIDLVWKRTTPDFTYDGYDRSHQISFAGGITIDASSAPEYKGRAELVNPEEQLAAALSSCYMLTFLAIAARKKLIVDEYTDHAIARLDKNPQGKLAVVETILSPQIIFSGAIPSPEELSQLHHKAHEACFIANSVNFPVVIK